MNEATDEMPKALAVLLAKQDITEVLYRYCQAIDTASLELLLTCFHADSTHDHGGFVGLSHDFCPIAIGFMTKLTAATHMVTNMTIAVDSDTATSACSFFSHQRHRNETTGHDENVLFVGRYRDRFERRGGDWKIAARVGTIDYQQTMPPSDGMKTVLKAAS